jgi:hypothetical protein
MQSLASYRGRSLRKVKQKTKRSQSYRRRRIQHPYVKCLQSERELLQAAGRQISRALEGAKSAVT